MKLRACFVIVSFLCAVVYTTLAQTAAPNSNLASTQVPRLIKFSGVAQDETHKPVSGPVGITFSLYKDQQGGSPLWVETQNVQADAAGHYTALLGSASAGGVPLSLFSSAEAHWISTQISGQRESARVLLMSVPYALKAADAETLGGLPASAFMHANPGGVLANGSSPASAPAGTLPPAGVTGKGTKDFVPLWTGTTALGNSLIYQTGGNLGIGTKTPKAAVDVASTDALGIQATVPGTQAAISGIATATKGGTTGVYGQSSDPSGNAVFGMEKATTGGIGVIGQSNATSGSSYGVYGLTSSTANFAAGVAGVENATTGQVSGVAGSTSSTTTFSSGVTGFEGAKTGAVSGVAGSTNSTTNSATGVSGFEGAATGVVSGVSGGTNSTTTSASGVIGFEGATTGVVFGVSGGTNSTSANAAGVNGYTTASSGQVFGVSGNTSSGTLGAAGVSGYADSSTGQVWGVIGTTPSSNGIGVLGNSVATSGFAVGVYGKTTSSGGAAGVFTNLGGGTGAVLLGNGANYANVFSVDASGNGSYAGNLNVTGKLTKGSGSFKIDHPLDPANKYLSHSFVESPDMMNVYNGNITTDRHGLATVNLPDYFEALNGDFRYQLTVLGQFAQAIVAKKIAANRFVIRTSRPHVEVSWQVTGIRHDAYANAYRIPVEEDKTAQEQGYYLHPEVFGQPESKGISAAWRSMAASQNVVADASQK
jgi:hypothetical protein